MLGMHHLHFYLHLPRSAALDHPANFVSLVLRGGFPALAGAVGGHRPQPTWHDTTQSHVMELIGGISALILPANARKPTFFRNRNRVGAVGWCFDGLLRAFFVVALVCHGELARDRPPPKAADGVLLADVLRRHVRRRFQRPRRPHGSVVWAFRVPARPGFRRPGSPPRQGLEAGPTCSFRGCPRNRPTR